MRKALSKSVLVMAAASGILTAAGGYAFADASADGAAVGSPGVGSGNAVQVPVHVPVNVCGNTVNVIGLLNPASGNKCANVSGGSGNGGQEASAGGTAAQSPGVLSGNVIQAPVHVPVNVCGNTANVIGLLNPASDNECANVSGGSDNGGQEASAGGTAAQSPGVLSGNVIQAPVHVPVNVCGNSVDVVGLLNPASGNSCGNGPSTEPPVVNPPVEPPVVTPPVVTPPVVTPPVTPPVVTPPVTPPVVTPPVTPPVVTPPVVTPPVVTPPVTPHTDESQTGNVPTVASGDPVSTAQLAHTGADTNLGLAGAASAAMVLGGTLLYRRTRASRK
ncbi:chaplin [Streptomyces sp. NBC_01240]|uniref:chaplin n=1 Tax=Streptomyces sp. NBC_01240 TaxID=2903793 RepID=UPI002E104CC7